MMYIYSYVYALYVMFFIFLPIYLQAPRCTDYFPPSVSNESHPRPRPLQTLVSWVVAAGICSHLAGLNQTVHVSQDNMEPSSVWLQRSPRQIFFSTDDMAKNGWTIASSGAVLWPSAIPRKNSRIWVSWSLAMNTWWSMIATWRRKVRMLRIRSPLSGRR